MMDFVYVFIFVLLFLAAVFIGAVIILLMGWLLERIARSICKD